MLRKLFIMFVIFSLFLSPVLAMGIDIEGGGLNITEIHNEPEVVYYPASYYYFQYLEPLVYGLLFGFLVSILSFIFGIRPFSQLLKIFCACFLFMALFTGFIIFAGRADLYFFIRHRTGEIFSLIIQIVFIISLSLLVRKKRIIVVLLLSFFIFVFLFPTINSALKPITGNWRFL